MSHLTVSHVLVAHEKYRKPLNGFGLMPLNHLAKARRECLSYTATDYRRCSVPPSSACPARLRLNSQTATQAKPPARAFPPTHSSRSRSAPTPHRILGHDPLSLSTRSRGCVESRTVASGTLRVTRDIRQRFLHQAVSRSLHFRRKSSLLQSAVFEVYTHLRLRRVVFEVPKQRRQQTKIIEHRRPQIQRQLAHPRHQFVYQHTSLGRVRCRLPLPAGARPFPELA